MYKVELVPIPARIQEKILKSLAELHLNRNKLANDCLATLIALDQRGLMESQTAISPSLVKNKMFGDSSKPCIIKLRKDLVDYMVMQSWNKSGAINQALMLGLREIASGARFASNYQSGRRQHYRPTAAITGRPDDSHQLTITEPWKLDLCCINGEYAGEQICGFCANFNDCGKFCYLDLKPKSRLDWCSRFKVTDSTKFINCINCKYCDGGCVHGITPNPHSHNCQQFYPAP